MIANVSTLVPDEAQGEYSKEHFDRISDVESQIDVFLRRRLLLRWVGLGERDTIKTDYHNDEALKDLARWN